MNRIGRRTLICMLLIIELAVVWNVVNVMKFAAERPMPIQKR
jgi:hypothetical protein